MTRPERSLLLYLETRAADYSGKINSCHLNKDDFAICERWHEMGYIRFARLKTDYCENKGRYDKITHLVILSPTAIADAHELRTARINRNIPDWDLIAEDENDD